MKATKVGKSKSAKSKTGLSFRYAVSGTPEELAAFVKTENFMQYPQYQEGTGLPLVFRNEPLLENPCKVGISTNNRYYLDDTDILEEMAMTEKMAKTSTIFAEKFAEKAVGKIGAIAGFMDKIDIPEVDAEVDAEETKTEKK
jgi:hypothetical protein